MEEIKIPKYKMELWNNPIKFYRYTNRKSSEPYDMVVHNRKEVISKLLAENVRKEHLIFILGQITKISTINYYDDECQVELLIVGKNRHVDRISFSE